MKKLIVRCLLAVAVVSLSACGSDKSEATHTSVTTSQETTQRSPVTTTTTDTQSKDSK